LRPDRGVPAAVPLLLAALLALAAVPTPGAARPNPHEFMNDAARCGDCHEQTPVRGKDDYSTVTFKDTIVSLCSKCHQDESYREEHPLELRPESAVPEDLHLDNAYTLTCATCHNVHGPHEADRPYVPRRFWEKTLDLVRRPTRYPTYFLRRPNETGGLCLACHPAGVVAAAGEAPPPPEQGFEEYVGSERCRECHAAVYDEWRKTLHAYNFQETKKNPKAVRAVFTEGGSQPVPRGDLRWTVGEHWTQRYLVQGKKELMVIPETWSFQAGTWTKEGSFSRPWLKYCAGCHVTSLNPFTGRFVEAGTGCESCHGPGRRHAESTDQSEIVNPSVLVESRRDMICESCHTAGHDRSGTFRFPVGYRPGQDLMRYYRGLVPKPGQDTKNYTGDGSYEDRHRQFHFWISRMNILTGATCDVCSAGRRASEDMESKSPEYHLSPDEMCGTCHRDIKKGQEAHSGHAVAAAGCLDCHPPLLDESRKRYSVHDHKFQFSPPTPEHVAGGDPCTGCHERKKVKPGRRARR
jgi:hypothetical protein